MSLSVASNVLR
jgi:type IV secretory pathway VirB4 component